MVIDVAIHLSSKGTAVLSPVGIAGSPLSRGRDVYEAKERLNGSTREGGALEGLEFSGCKSTRHLGCTILFGKRNRGFADDCEDDRTLLFTE